MSKTWAEILPISTKKKIREIDWSKTHPKQELILRPFQYFEPKDLKVILLGQDPYPNPDDATGLAFSTDNGKIPQSLKRVFKEYQSDLGFKEPLFGNLENWAREGVLLLNTTPTFGDKTHKRHWQPWLNTLLHNLFDMEQPFVIIAWGRNAQLVLPPIPEHVYVVTGGHPSPLNRRVPFLGGRYFTKTNQWLKQNNIQEVDWKLS